MTEIKDSLYSGLEILVGEPATDCLRAQTTTLKRLITTESEATYDVPEIVFWRLRGRVNDFLRPPLERIGRKFPHFRTKVGDPILRSIYPSTWFGGWTLGQELVWAWSDTLKLLEKSQFAVALVDGCVVAVIAYKAGGKTADGRLIFEITKSSTLPDYRGRGIFRRLREAVVALVAERYGPSPIMTFTRHPSVIRHCQELGWHELTLEEYTELLERVGREGPPAESMAAFRRRWRAFLHDPTAPGATR